MSATLAQTLQESYTADVLGEFVKLCGGMPSKMTRKGDRVKYIVAALQDRNQLRQIWNRMDALSRKAVAAAYHNDGVFDASAFVAQYGSLPERPRGSMFSFYPERILMDLFIHRGQIPADLMSWLEPLAPPPESFQVEGLAQVPETLEIRFEHTDQSYTLAMTVVETEEAGWHDLLLLLQLVDQGALRFSSSSDRLASTSTRLLLDNLLHGDFLDNSDKNHDEKIKTDDTIRPFGLTIFARDADLLWTSEKGKLTEQGRAFLTTQAPEILLEGFERWTKEGHFDELLRIPSIKGKRSRDVRLTKPGMRRERIVEALSWCPTNVWISISDFYRAIKIWHFNFALEEGYYSHLSVGYDSYHAYYNPWASDEEMWLLTNGLYIKAVLWEYLGTIGALDLAYISPEEEQSDPNYEDLEFNAYSSYDGLFYFRINPLGAFLFGQEAEYKPSRRADESYFAVAPDGQVKLLSKPVPPVVTTQLDQIAAPGEQGDYRLDQQKVLLALEQGAELEAFSKFLARHNQGPLPPEIEAWLEQVYEASRAFSVKSEALLIRAAHAELMQQALADAELGKFCTMLDERTLVIPANRKNRFRDRLRELGYGLR
jgi:hypothetical protein